LNATLKAMTEILLECAIREELPPFRRGPREWLVLQGRHGIEWFVYGDAAGEFCAGCGLRSYLYAKAFPLGPLCLLCWTEENRE
jgi:hypothetical protein